jgi:hypothetical protein
MTEMFAGYSITRSQQELEAFIDQARREYDTLAGAIAPVDEKIANLQRDWHPRSAHFWGEALYRDIPPIREAARACSLLFDKGQSHVTPIPIVIYTTLPGFIGYLHHIDSVIEEAGILLTVYLQTPRPSSVEGQIRERQRLMRALQKVSRATHNAIDEALGRLSQAPQKQVRLLTPTMPTEPGQNQPSAACQKPGRQTSQHLPTLQIGPQKDGKEGA